MKAKARIEGLGGRDKTPCLRKGFLVGRAACSVNALYTQISVLDEPDVAIVRGAVADLRRSVKALRKSVRSAQEDFQAMDDAAGHIEKTIGTKPGELKADLAALQRGFRRMAKASFVECGIPNVGDSALADLLGDHAFFLEKAKTPG